MSTEHDERPAGSLPATDVSERSPGLSKDAGGIAQGGSGPKVGDGEAARLNAFLDSIVDNIPTMLFVKDAVNLRYELFNRAGEELSGLSRHDVYGKDDSQLFSREVAAFFQEKDREVLRGGRVLDIPEEPMETKGGQRWLHTKKIPILGPDGTPRHLLGISLDITDRKLAVEGLKKAHEELEARVLDRTRELVNANARLQREIDERRRTEAALQQAELQLRHAQKMEAVGRLAGGIAHDFNNLLSVVMSYAVILAAGLDPNTDLAQGLEEIRKAGDRAAVLTQQLLAFSRQQVLAPQVINLNQVIGRMDNMLRRVIGEEIDLLLQPAADLGCTKIDPGQLEQVVMNLVVNARDAMPDGGELTITTANVDLDPDQLPLNSGLAHGSYVVLAVTDTGVGMDEVTQARAFEPFFTTKERGKGTGLGLSTVFGIVHQSGGHVTVESVVNAGATFKVYLARTSDAAVAKLDQPPLALSSRGTETILLVEDEDPVRAVVRAILTERGYQVLEAARGRHALELSRRTPGTIDLLLTDIAMPEMNGRVLAEQLRLERPDMEVILMSGYPDKAIGNHDVIDSPIAFLQKPITPLTLTTLVRLVLDTRARRRRG